MRILITTGIYKPEPGGPAFYSANLADKLIEAGHNVKIITYSDKTEYDFDKELAYDVVRIKRSGKLLNYFKYFLAVLKDLRHYNVVYATDYVSVGVPVYLATRIMRKKYIIRIGGDFIWEKYVNNHKPVTLRDFYNDKLFLQYKFLFNLSGRVIHGASKIIFNSDEIKDLFLEHYNLDTSKLAVVHNAIPAMQHNLKRGNIKKEIVFFGRFIEVKNIISTIKAFSKFDNSGYKLILIGHGPQEGEIRDLVNELGLEEKVEILQTMRAEQLWQRIINCYYIILPSWSDISPNQVYECLHFGIPVLLTQENYLPLDTSSWLKIDPKSIDDIAKKMNYLSNNDNYEKFVNIQKQTDLNRNWDNILEEHLELFKKLV